MIINNLNVICITFVPLEADTPLLIDPDAMLSNAIPLQRFKSVSRRNSQIVDILSIVNHPELPARNALNVLWQRPRANATPDTFSLLGCKRLQHEQ